MNRYRRLLIPILLLPPILACSAATRLITGSNPSATDSVDASPSPSVQETAPVDGASCPLETAAILRASEAESPVLTTFPRVSTNDSLFAPLVTYTVQGDALSAPVLADVPKNLLKYQADAASQRSAWGLFTALIPADQRAMLSQFQIVTDGPGGVLSAVEQTANDPRSWLLAIDIADASDTKNLSFTLLHEFGHLLTLSPAQVPPDPNIFNDPQSPRQRNRALAACPNYFPGEGCSLPDSYLNQFYARYWNDIFEQWQSIDSIQDDVRRDSRLDDFFHRYSDRFVDSYAATSPSEDIAETWAYYILNPKPVGSSIADQKLRFFYEYPELVSLREQILKRLCAVHP